MFGTGFRGTASGAIGRAIADVNKKSKDTTAPLPALILAVDTPSGLPSDGEAGEEPILKAHHTVTFTAPKVGQLISRNSAAVGSLRVVNIGSPASLVEEIGKSAVRWSDPGEFADMPLVRKSDSNKGMFGNVLIIAGSLGKSGAAVMSGSAALWSGAGLVTVATPDSVLPIVASAHPEYMTEPLDGDEGWNDCSLEFGQAIRGDCEGADGARRRARAWAKQKHAGIYSVGGDDDGVADDSGCGRAERVCGRGGQAPKEEE